MVKEKEQNNDVLVSVIIPVYNSALWVKQTLDCVCLNSHKNLEVICILDKPTDGSDKIVHDYAARDSRVVVIDQMENKGQSAAKNLGFRQAKGDWIHFMDSDDLIGIHFYRDMLASANLADGINGVLCNDIVHERDGFRQVVQAPMIMSNFGDIADFAKDMVIPLWAWIIRHEFLKDINFAFPEDKRQCEDYEIMPDTIDKMGRICIADGAFYIYKKRVNSASINRPPEDRAPDEDRGHKIMDDLAHKRGGNQRHDIYSGKSYFNGKLVVMNCAGGVTEVLLFGRRLFRTKGKK